jgi:hypothetical protein
MTNQEAQNKMSAFIRKQREERYAFGWKQHEAMIEFKRQQLKERSDFIAKLKGGSQC